MSEVMVVAVYATQDSQNIATTAAQRVLRKASDFDGLQGCKMAFIPKANKSARDKALVTQRHLNSREYTDCTEAWMVDGVKSEESSRVSRRFDRVE